MAGALGLALGDVKAEAQLDHLGVTSSTIVSLSGELEDRWHMEISPALLYETATIAQLARKLAERCS